MTVDIEAIDSKSLRYSQKIRDKYDDNSLWLKLTKGPLGFSLYAALQYPKVFLKRLFSEKSLNPTWTIREETSIRILKWTLDAPLAAIRKNFTFIEYIMKTFGCSEPYTPIKDVDGVKGYWLGPERWENNHPDAIILYIHGGGYVATSSFFGIRFLCYLIKHLRIQHGKHVRVLAIDYDLAPEEPFPNSLGYIKRAYEWLTEEKLVSGDKNVFLCGDSSGANMVLGLLQLINLTDGLGNTTTNNDHDVMIDNLLYYDNISIVNDQLSTGKKSPLAGAILISPWIELSCEKLSRHKNSKYDYLSGQFASISAENYLFGKIGNPSRLQKLYQQPINEASILSWLEKVEDSFDFADIDDPYYYEQKLNTTAATTSVTTTAAMNNRTSVLVNDVFEQFSKSSERTSKSSYKTTRTSFRSPRNSKVVRNSSTLSVIIDSYLNTKTFTHNIDNNNNNNYYKDYGHNNNDDLDTTKKMSTHHVLRLQQIIEKNKTEISRKQSANNLYANPLVSPLHIKSEVLAKFPPLFISYGGKEIFKDDIEAFCKKCIESKSSSDDSIYPDVTIETDAEMIHAYPIFIDVFGEHSKNTLNHIASFISSKISPLPPTKLSYINSVREYRKESISGFTVSTSAVLPSEDDYSGISARDLLSLTSDGKSTNTLLEPNKNNKRTPNSLKLERNFSRQVPNSRLLKSKTNNKHRKHRKMNLGI